MTLYCIFISPKFKPVRIPASCSTLIDLNQVLFYPYYPYYTYSQSGSVFSLYYHYSQSGSVFSKAQSQTRSVSRAASRQVSTAGKSIARSVSQMSQVSHWFFS